MPDDRGHNTTAPGFGAVPYPFAGLSGRRPEFEDEGQAMGEPFIRIQANLDGRLDFEDTYDGLADQLDEGNDAFNNDTFGGGSTGADFDFSGQTAKMVQNTEQEHNMHRPRQPAPRGSPPRAAAKPARSGYERYAEPGYIPQLEANASLWGLQSKPMLSERPAAVSRPSTGRKMMSLEEVEAAMRAQSRGAGTPQSGQSVNQAVPDINTVLGQQTPIPHPPPGFSSPQFNDGRQVQRPPPSGPLHMQHLQQQQQPPPPHMGPPRGIQQMPQQAMAFERMPHVPQQQQSLQNPARTPTGPAVELPDQARIPLAALPQTRVAQNPLGNPEQLLNLSDEKRAEYLAEDAKRAKRNHKIYLLSKDNGLMTPQDKNFITRIQLQQLVTATGGTNEDSADSMFAEDFYYQVLNQIRGARNPNLPMNNFAQTYLTQAGGRGNRRVPRGGENHLRRMEQQVQRAVEAAKSRPKNKQLVIEGSLGKISFSNSKTPRPILTIKPQESNDGRPQITRPRAVETKAGRKAALRDIETIYTTLMKMEEHARQMPRPPTEESSGNEIEAHINWRQRLHELNQVLWAQLKVLEPIEPK